MSWWTYVHGVIEVDAYDLSNEGAMFLAQRIVKRMPLITGSEGPVRYYFAKPHGSNWWGWENNIHREGQTKVLITLCGNLRDRMLSETIRETAKFLSRLSRNIDITSVTLGINAWNGSYVFNNPEWLLGKCENIPIVNVSTINVYGEDESNSQK